MDASNFLLFLRLDRAPSDTVRAAVLDAIAECAQQTGLADLRREALRARPAAHPLIPPREWADYYRDAFVMTADTECGVDPDEAPRYCVEYWQSFTDAERHERLANPWMGGDDGRQDADNLNAA